MAISDAELEEYKRKFHTWLTAEVGLTAEMVKSLQEPSDDWTFIIKIHALLEVALNHMVAGRLRHKELNEIVERLSIAGKTGKIAFAEAFGLLSKESVKFVRLISEVRRNLVHDIKHFDFDLYRYLMNLDKNKQEEWKAALTFNLGSSVHQSLRDFSITFPQFS